MQTVAPAEIVSISQFWRDIFPQGNAEKPRLFSLIPGRELSWSVKDINAQAHCVAAYLFEKKISRGEHIFVYANDPCFFLLVELACQFIGVIPIQVESGIQDSQFEKIAETSKVKLILIDDTGAFIKERGIPGFLQALQHIIIGSEEEPQLPEEKLITFDRTIELGKIAWRNFSKELKEIKASILPTEVCTTQWSGAEKLQNITYATFIMKARNLASNLKKEGVDVILGIDINKSYERRATAVYAVLINQGMCYLQHSPNLQVPFGLAHAPKGLACKGDFLAQLKAKMCESLVIEKVEKAIQVANKRREYLQNGQKPPIGLRLQYNLQKGSFYNPLRKKFGKNFVAFYCNENPAPKEVLNFWEDVGLKILTR